MYNRLGTIPACDRRRDRRTDILPRHSPRYAYASRGKNRARGIVGLLLKLNTDRHEASRGLFATAELLVMLPQATGRGGYYVPLSQYPVQTSAFFSLRTNTDRISMKFGEVNTTKMN